MSKLINYRGNRWKNHLLPAALLSGILLIAAFPPLELGFIAWLALIPFFVSLAGLKPGKAFIAGIIFAVPVLLYTNLYLVNVLIPYLDTALGSAAMIALILYLSLFYGLFGLLSSMITRHGKPLFAVFAIPALWVITEYTRSMGFMGYTVGYLGYTQWQYPALLSVVSVYGYWGLPFMMSSFQLIMAFYYRKKTQLRETLYAVLLLLLFIGTGLLLPSVHSTERSDHLIKVALIQNNSTAEEVFTNNKEVIAARYLQQTNEALMEDPDIELVVWPETIVDLDFRNGPVHYAQLLNPGSVFDRPLLYGARTIRNDQLNNSILFYKPGQNNIPLYHKQRLVPFVEFFPAEQLLNNLLNLNLLLGRYTAGDQVTLFSLDQHLLAGIICFESYFGDHARLFAQAGAEHLFVLTNDNWFGSSIGLDQHAQVAAIRAVETGIGVTQAANSGITISFDYLGRELFRTAKQTKDTVIFSLPLTQRQTYYRQYGDYFPALCLIFLIGGGVLPLAPKMFRFLSILFRFKANAGNL